MSAIFVGYRTITSPDFSDFVVEPKAPKNYKDPEKISAYIEEARAETRASASSKPFTGIFEEASICLYDDGADSKKEGFTCLNTYKGASEFPDFIGTLATMTGEGTQAFMFNAYAFMRLIAMQALRSKLNSQFINYWLLNHPTSRGLIVDLPKIFLPSSEEVSRISYTGLFHYFGLTLAAADMSDTQRQCQKLYELYCAANKFNGLVFNEVSSS
jgi:hypothetical protein